jgi:hypothetical protein
VTRIKYVKKCKFETFSRRNNNNLEIFIPFSLSNSQNYKSVKIFYKLKLYEKTLYYGYKLSFARCLIPLSNWRASLFTFAAILVARFSLFSRVLLNLIWINGPQIDRDCFNDSNNAGYWHSIKTLDCRISRFHWSDLGGTTNQILAFSNTVHAT